MEKQIKPFRTQYIECYEDGMHGLGSFLRWEDHPEMLPSPFSKAAEPIVEELTIDPNAGLQLIACNRFGGNCSSSHPECRKLRGYQKETGV